MIPVCFDAPRSRSQMVGVHKGQNHLRCMRSACIRTMQKTEVYTGAISKSCRPSASCMRFKSFNLLWTLVESNQNQTLALGKDWRWKETISVNATTIQRPCGHQQPWRWFLALKHHSQGSIVPSVMQSLPLPLLIARSHQRSIGPGTPDAICLAREERVDSCASEAHGKAALQDCGFVGTSTT